MNWKATPPAIEIAAAASATACLGAAVGFAVMRTAPFGAGFVEAVPSGAAVALLAWLLLGRIDRQDRSRGEHFVPVEAPGAELATEDILLLDEPLAAFDEPLPAVGGESRVVRLFAAPPAATEPTPCVGPSEMIARIEDFLGHARCSAGAGGRVQPDRAAAEDASEALHAALADIRRSLRQG